MVHDRLPSLAALKAFDAAARLGSFQQAAQALHLTPSAVSHQIRGLELEFGQPLFSRRHRKVELTEAGRTLQAYVARGFEELRRGAAALRQDRRPNVLRISAAPAFAAAFLTHRIEAFEAAHKGMELRLEVSHAVVDLGVEAIDAAVRLLTAPPADLHSELLIPIVAGPVCTPELAARLKTPADLAQATRLCISQDPRGWRPWLRAAGLDEDVPPGRELWFETLNVAIQGALDGLGVALAPLTLTAQHVQAGRLATPFRQTVRSRFEYRLVCRRGEAELPKIARFRRWLTSELSPFAA
jgi:LysR family glycine cleavage system transcriptional activator